jgi:ribose 5-phosphate isomerase B
VLFLQTGIKLPLSNEPLNDGQFAQLGLARGICHDTYSGHQGVEHDQMNVLVMGSRIIGVKLAEDIVRAFLAAEFSNEERHVRRVAKVRALELKMLKN